ncbi:MAG TPA: GAF domain-containing sensor histidine kinase [Sandaracinaceae bacterium]
MRPNAAAMEIAALDKREFDTALEAIIRKDADTLEVERVNFWTLRAEPPSIHCELGYVRGLRAYEHGAVLSDCPRYLEALRAEEVIVAHDARADVRTSELTSAYLVPLGITSMLDVPVWARGELVGVLCHEHVGEARRWRRIEQDFAVMVAQAVATCLEARECVRAERAGRRSAFLAQATAVLTESLDIESIPARLIELCVPELADWCVLDVVKDGGPRSRVAVAHVDPQKRPFLLELARRYPPDVGTVHASARTFASGQSLLVPEFNDAALARYCVDAEHCRGLRALGTRSLMAVPLTARGRRVGAIVFASTTRRYERDDQLLAEAIAARAAIALDNARLHHEATEAIARRDEFLAMAAHELYTPLTSLSLAAAQLERSVPPSAMRSVAVVQRGAARLTRLVDEMLDVARTASRSIALRPERADLAQIARRAVDGARDAATLAGCSLALRADEAVMGTWDPARLEQLLTNLLRNSIRFGAGRPIDVAVSSKGGTAWIVVRDHGPGIAAADVERIFDRFERSAPPPGGGGLGLGLFIARGIAEAHGGSVRALSTPGHGATFVVELPGAE